MSNTLTCPGCGRYRSTCLHKTLVIQGIKPVPGGVPGIYFRVVTPCGKHDLTKQYIDLLATVEIPGPAIAALHGTLYNPMLGCAIVTEAGGGLDIGLGDMMDEVAMLISAENWDLTGYGV